MKSDSPDHRLNTKTRRHIFKILNTTDIVCGVNCLSSRVQVYKYKHIRSRINALFSKFFTDQRKLVRRDFKAGLNDGIF
jgi:hypothetical protein